MTPQLICLADVTPQPWRNGGGITRELLAWPSASDWHLRLSVADIATDGPFSVFDGAQRWFVVLQGAGVALSIDGQAQRQTAADPPLHFDGAATTDCRLIDGPTRDLNLMLRCRPGGLVAAVPGQDWAPPGVACGLFTRVAGHCAVAPSATLSATPSATPAAGAPALEHRLPALALLWCPNAPALLRWQPAGPSDHHPHHPPQAWWLWAGPETLTP